MVKDEMSYRQAVNNVMRGQNIPYRKATFAKLWEMIETIEQQDWLIDDLQEERELLLEQLAELREDEE